MKTRGAPKVSKVSASEVAKWFLAKAHQDKKKVTNKKLQKLLYYAQGWHLANFQCPLFPETIEAWIHGPAIASVYHEYKSYGFSPILTAGVVSPILAKDSSRLLGDVWRVYGKYDGDYLERLSHSEPPWQLAREDMEALESSQAEISLESLISYFGAMLQE